MSNSEQHNSEAAPDDNPGLKRYYEFNDEVRKVYSNGMCVAALRGEKVPAAAADLGTLSYAVKLCILRGIRHHHGFGMELHDPGPDYSCFRRALNARAIMSDAIPDIDILARRYPQMRYQVGRACAVAGYTDLYKELGLLPDITIAEEAQDSVIRNQRKVTGVRATVAMPRSFSTSSDSRCAGRS
ncbi:hypothetical protein GE09DRAFT_1282248 [Coniochaeta sp. 2T2.1]|nr:hypothetical protein GE09DRAFT_1282248 [Coniochaeta sp. 2T2.1]